MSSGHPESPPQSFVVQTDRDAIHRWHGGLVTVHAVVTLAIVALTLYIAHIAAEVDMSGLMIAPFLIILLGQTFQLSWHCYVWGGRAAVATPLEMDASTFVLTTPAGRIVLPWEAIAALRIRSRLFGKVLVITTLPGVTPQSAGVQFEGSPRVWKRVLRSGLMIGSRGIHQDLGQVLQAAAFLSRGRVRVG